MNKSRTYCFQTLLAVITLLLAGAKVLGQTDAPQKEIAVGERAPMFTLKDHTGQEFSLEAMTKKGPVAVVFIRSIGWCSYCQLQTVQLSENLEKLQTAGGQVVIVCYDPPEKVKRFAERRKTNVPILSDPDSKTIDAYGMRSANGVADQIGSARHGTFVIDKSGIIRSRPRLISYEGDSAIETLMSALKEASTVKP